MPRSVRCPTCSIPQIRVRRLSDNRALVVLVFNDREVQNRIIQLERHHSADELRRAANLLTERCRGKTLAQVRADILREMHETRESMNALMKDAINVAERVFKADESSRMEYVIAGETNLMGAGELSSVDKLRRLFEAFSEKRDILNLLDHSLRADGVRIFIGQESGFRILDDVSMVTAPYSADNEVVGVIGVIGPTRMAYERVIPSSTSRPRSWAPHSLAAESPCAARRLVETHASPDSPGRVPTSPPAFWPFDSQVTDLTEDY
jgi:heat-inducible transcriptional repressor